MYSIDQYPQILLHLKSLSRWFKRNSAGWIGIYCPYCNDATRKVNPRDGHFYVHSSTPYAHCFRCSTQVGLYKLLVDTGFQDVAVLNVIREISNITYGTFKRHDRNISNKDLDKRILSHYDYFVSKYPNEFQSFREYIERRCLDINPVRFRLLPNFIQGQLVVQFVNSDGNIVANRSIFNNDIRYIGKKDGKKYPYYFQDMGLIDECENVIICEGAFDLINLFSYCIYFDRRSFYLSIGGNNYKGTVIELINNYLLIGKYTINIVFDQGLQFMDRMIYGIKTAVNELNPEIGTNFFLPIASKDVSELMMIGKL